MRKVVEEEEEDEEEEEEEEREEEEEKEEDKRVREEGNAGGSPLGLWGHTKPEKLVLSSLELGNFTCDRLWHTQQLEEEVF